jgi:hypothetical protein
VEGHDVAIPPSIKKILPSFRIDKDIAAVNVADLKKLFPSLEMISGRRNVPLDGEVRMSREEVGRLLSVALASVNVDEAWYLTQVPDLRRDIQRGKFRSVAHHYYMHGYLEGRLPEKPTVNEKFYLEENEDVAAGVKAGKFKTGFEHFVKNGYFEGRSPVPVSESKGKQWL